MGRKRVEDILERVFVEGSRNVQYTVRQVRPRLLSNFPFSILFPSELSQPSLRYSHDMNFFLISSRGYLFLWVGDSATWFRVISTPPRPFYPQAPHTSILLFFSSWRGGSRSEFLTPRRARASTTLGRLYLENLFLPLRNIFLPSFFFSTSII